ncbi:MAG: hypothetical protein WCO60_09785 [Verrucomicrobiota bacterium]
MVPANSFDKVASDIWCWRAYDESVRTELSSCALALADGIVLVDPIDLTPRAMDELSVLGEIAAVVLTNGNHARSSLRFRERFDVPILAHEHAMAELGIPVDGLLGAESLVAGSLRVICLLGGGPGEIAFYNPKGRLHVGDALVNVGSVGFSILPDKYCEDRVVLEVSLRQLLALDFEMLTFAHGAPLLNGAGEHLAKLLAPVQ